MPESDANAQQLAAQLGANIGPLMADDLVRWLNEDIWRRIRTRRLLLVMGQDPSNKLNIRPIDIFHPDHLPYADITEAAKDRCSGRCNPIHPHVTACSVCKAFIETEVNRSVPSSSKNTDVSD